MKRLLALLAILLISQVGYGQQKMDQLFNAFRGESDVTSVNIGNIIIPNAASRTDSTRPVTVTAIILEPTVVTSINAHHKASP
mgnify:CR=1 FL=1